MDIDWKVVCQSLGYKSLKAAYTKDVQDAEATRRRGHRPMRDKAKFKKHFDWVISRAKHYAARHRVTLDVILNQWEAGRDYWWLNYYQDCRQPKAYSWRTRRLYPATNGIRKLAKESWGGSSSKFSKHSVCREIMREDRLRVEAERTRKGRWCKARKIREKEIRKYRNL